MMSSFNVQVLCVLAELLGGALAWGPDGHTIVAHIADYYLSPDVKAALNTDLYEISLDEASDWPDDYDHTPEGKWSFDLHFINYHGRACKFDWATDCKDDWCNVGAIANYTKQIFDPSVSKADRFFALKFVIHMVGDVHQPLHVSSGDDIGGNAITIPRPHFSTKLSRWSHSKTNLHAVWDEAIILQDLYDIEDNITLLGASPPYHVHYHKWQLLADKLEKKLGDEWAADVKTWQAAVANFQDEADYRKGLSIVAEESAELSCKAAYNYPDGSAVQSGDILDRAYYLAAKPVVEQQLAKGGVRLAQILEETLKRSLRSGAPTASLFV